MTRNNIDARGAPHCSVRPPPFESHAVTLTALSAAGLVGGPRVIFSSRPVAHPAYDSLVDCWQAKLLSKSKEESRTGGYRLVEI